jgi:hypothetical protein
MRLKFTELTDTGKDVAEYQNAPVVSDQFCVSRYSAISGVNVSPIQRIISEQSSKATKSRPNYRTGQLINTSS